MQAKCKCDACTQHLHAMRLVVKSPEEYSKRHAEVGVIDSFVSPAALVGAW